ncbi:MAG: hypothetical protein KGL91_03215 [Xanthomonadaceae bacterium]|nr:hypothetical protein [Xanthomonadaceae bacterium]
MASGWRPCIESALCLDLLRLLRTRCIVPGCTSSGTLTWTRDGREHVASVGYRADLGEASGTLTLAYRADGQDAQDVIPLSTVANNYGGRNWFMHCPATGKRARKLYKWNGLAHFRHRDTVRPRPTYASQRDSGTERVNRQRWALRRKMGDDRSDLFSEPWKPKGMHWRTYERHAARDAELGAEDAHLLAGLLARMGCPLEGFSGDLAVNLGSPARARMTTGDKPRKQANPRLRVQCGATRHRDGQPCQAKSEPGKRRCRFHGGRSTGPKTEAGKARALANLRQYREPPMIVGN